MLSPSDTLQDLLAELQLCTPQQLAACEPEVRRLAGDLPGFDSCWLDVLVAHRMLTPWQADCLQSDQPRWMSQGDYRLRRPLGDHTWEAESPDRHRLVVMERVQASSADVTSSLVALVSRRLEHIEQIRHLIPHTVCLPRELITDTSTGISWLVSPYVPGWSLDELLIRGGRLPWPAVQHLGRQLLHGISQLQQGDLQHGDICLRNIRLQPDGQAVLVAPFLARFRQPSTGFRSDLRLRDVQHCAPELVGSGRAVDAVSDLYSTGVALWQLLTARPPFLSADPVTCLMQCQERDIEDVREWVPDCPDQLAHLLQTLTRRRPELRPRTASEALSAWPRESSAQRQSLRELIRNMPDRVQRSTPVLPTLRRRQQQRRGLLGAAALATMVIVGLSSNLIPLPLTVRRTTITETVDDAPPTITSGELTDVSPTKGSQPPTLPPVSADGKLVLQGGQTYPASALSTTGLLQITAHGDAPAEVLLTGQSVWKISAEQVQLQNICVRRSQAPRSVRQPLLDVRSRELQLQSCLIGDPADDRSTGIRWGSPHHDQTRIEIRDTVFRAGYFAVHLRNSGQQTELHNVLFDRCHVALRLDQRSSAEPLSEVVLNQVTQFQGDSLVDVVHQQPSPELNLQLWCGQSVLAPQQSLVRVASGGAEKWNSKNVTVSYLLQSGAGPSVVPARLTTAVWLDPTLGHLVELPEDQQLIEGLLLADPEFRSSGSTTSPFAHTELVDYDGPKLGLQLPGVQVSRLPRPSTQPMPEESRVSTAGR